MDGLLAALVPLGDDRTDQMLLGTRVALSLFSALAMVVWCRGRNIAVCNIGALRYVPPFVCGLAVKVLATIKLRV